MVVFKEIENHLDKDTEGYDVVLDAIDTMQRVAWHINDMKRKHEHAVRLQVKPQGRGGVGGLCLVQVYDLLSSPKLDIKAAQCCSSFSLRKCQDIDQTGPGLVWLFFPFLFLEV